MLGQAVDSNVRVDVTIVDDASNDGSQDVVRKLVERDSRVRAIYHDQNRRPHPDVQRRSRRRSTATTSCSCRRMTSPRTRRLHTRAAALFEANPSVGLVYGGAVCFSVAPPACRNGTVDWLIWSGREWLGDRYRVGRNALLSPEAIVRRSVLEQVGGGYNKALPHAADLEMWLRAAIVSDVGYLAGADQALYRMHPANMHRSIHGVDSSEHLPGDLRLGDLHERLAAFDSAIDWSDGRVSDASELKVAVRQALALEALHQVNDAYDMHRVHVRPVEEFISFAEREYPDIWSTGTWKALARRRRAESKLAPRASPCDSPPTWSTRTVEAGFVGASGVGPGSETVCETVNSWPAT